MVLIPLRSGLGLNVLNAMSGDAANDVLIPLRSGLGLNDIPER